MIIDCALYTRGRRHPEQLHLDDALEACQSRDDSFVWIGLHEPTHEELDRVTAEFELHPLAVEDAIKAHQRSKLERYGDVLFLVFKTARYDDASERIEFAEIQLFAGDRFVVTVRHGQASALAPVRHQLEADPDRLSLGPIAVVHGILDRVVDDYRPVLDGLDHDILEIETEVFSPDRTNPAQRIYKLRRQVLDMYRNVEPLIEPLDRLVPAAAPTSASCTSSTSASRSKALGDPSRRARPILSSSMPTPRSSSTVACAADRSSKIAATWSWPVWPPASTAGRARSSSNLTIAASASGRRGRATGA